MDLREAIDGFIEEAVIYAYSPEVASELLLSEDFVVPDGLDVVYLRDLVEALHRVRVRVPGGGYLTKRKFGRKDPRRSMIAKRSARKGRAARMRAMRNPRSKMKRKRTLAARKRLMGASHTRGGYRGAHGTKRHGAPRTHRRY